MKIKREKASRNFLDVFSVLVGQNYNSDEIGNSIDDSSRITVFFAIFAVV